eukprot:6187438-Pleurochrysis_carterae.AAC.4
MKKWCPACNMNFKKAGGLCWSCCAGRSEKLVGTDSTRAGSRACREDLKRQSQQRRRELAEKEAGKMTCGIAEERLKEKGVEVAGSRKRRGWRQLKKERLEEVRGGWRKGKGGLRKLKEEMLEKVERGEVGGS